MFTRTQVILLILVCLFLCTGNGIALVTHQDPNLAASERTLHQYLASEYRHCPKFPYWNRIGRVGQGTGIYLGEGFVLTVTHVGMAPFINSRNEVFQPVPNSLRIYPNADGSLSELCVFKINIPRGNRSLGGGRIRISAIKPTQDLVLLGTGYSAKSRNLEWTDDSKLRWGINRLAPYSAEKFVHQDWVTHCCQVVLDPGHLECQGAPGDSGGAVFQYNFASKAWELTGVIVAAVSAKEDEKNRIGDVTYIAYLDPMKQSPVPIGKNRLPPKRFGAEKVRTAFQGKNRYRFRRFLLRRRNQ